MASLRDGKVLSGAAAAWGGGMQKVVLKKPIAEELQPEEVVAADTLVADGEVSEHQQVALADIPQAEFTDSAAAASDLLALNTVQSLVDSTVQAAEPAKEEDDDDDKGGWLLFGGAAVLGGGVAALAIADSDDNDDPAAPPSDEVAVVVERTGAFIDEDADGVLDEGEDTAAVFGEDGTADLANLQVTIQFNDVPETALNLTGFGTDDLLEFDVAALQENGIILPGGNELTKLWVSASTTKNVIVPIFDSGTMFPFFQFPFSFTVSDLAGNDYSGQYGLAAWSMYSLQANASEVSTGKAWMAYWSDSGNALNSVANVLPDYSSYGSGNNPTVVSHINAGDYAATYGGVVDFIFPERTYVIVDADGAWIDGGTRGVVDAGDTTAAVFSGGGNADLAANAVTIHFHAAPDDGEILHPLDLAGFDANDQIEVDLDAYFGLQPNGTTIPLSSQIYASVSSYRNGSPTVSLSIYPTPTTWITASVYWNAVDNLYIRTSEGGTKVAYHLFDPELLTGANVDFVYYPGEG